MNVPNEIIVAVITLTGTILTGAISLVIYIIKVLNEVNDAVNHRHKKLPSEISPPKVYDMLWDLSNRAVNQDKKLDEIIIWKNQYSDGPLDTGDKVRVFVQETEDHFDAIDVILSDMKASLDGLHRSVDEVNKTIDPEQ